MIQASGGMATSLPMALITPWAITTVAFSRGGPDTGTILAPRIAKYCGSPPCASIWGAAARSARRVTANASAERHRRTRTDRIEAPLWETFRTTGPRPSFFQTHEASQKLQKSQGTGRIWGKRIKDIARFGGD